MGWGEWERRTEMKAGREHLLYAKLNCSIESIKVCDSSISHTKHYVPHLLNQCFSVPGKYNKQVLCLDILSLGCVKINHSSIACLRKAYLEGLAKAKSWVRPALVVAVELVFLIPFSTLLSSVWCPLLETGIWPLSKDSSSLRQHCEIWLLV